jgi:hypothetical protein
VLIASEWQPSFGRKNVIVITNTGRIMTKDIRQARKKPVNEKIVSVLVGTAIMLTVGVLAYEFLYTHPPFTTVQFIGKVVIGGPFYFAAILALLYLPYRIFR